MKRSYKILTALFLAAATTMPVWAGENPVKSQSTSKSTNLPDSLIPDVANNSADTITVKLANDVKMVLFLKDSKQLQMFRNYSLDSLMMMLDTYVSDAENMDLESNQKEVTVSYYPAKETNNPDAPQQINIIVRNNEKGTTERKNVQVKVDYSEAGKTETVKIVEVEKETDEEADLKIEKEEEIDCPPKRTDWEFAIDLGFNTWIDQNNGIVETPDLRGWGSRYVSLNWQLKHRIGGENSPVHLQSGVDFAFNNYMFEGNTYAYNDKGVTRFDETEVHQLEKSKLTASSVNIPLMLKFEFKEKDSKKTGFKVGFGGFAGYRLGSHTKQKYQLEGDTKKDKVRGSFNQEDFQYGVMAVVGYRGFELFGKYNINTVFKENRGPEVNTLSFGIRL